MACAAWCRESDCGLMSRGVFPEQQPCHPPLLLTALQDIVSVSALAERFVLFLLLVGSGDGPPTARTSPAHAACQQSLPQRRAGIAAWPHVGAAAAVSTTLPCVGLVSRRRVVDGSAADWSIV